MISSVSAALLSCLSPFCDSVVYISPGLSFLQVSRFISFHINDFLRGSDGICNEQQLSHMNGERSWIPLITRVIPVIIRIPDVRLQTGTTNRGTD